MQGGVSRGLAAALVVVMLVAPFTMAQEELELYPKPATEQAEKVQALFNGVTWIALAIFVFVEGLLIYVIWRFRKNKTVPKGETHRGHTKAEIAWSVVPALILIGIGAASVQAMEDLDRIPEDADFAIGVEAQQFAWVFTYPDGTQSINTMYVESGKRVRIDLTSTDVIHAFWVPAFAIKLDAVPGRVNQQWFDAPEPGEYLIQCAEYCGVGHHGMRASVKTFAPGSQNSSYGPPPRMGGGAGDADFTVTILEEGGTSQSEPWSLDPPALTLKVGEEVTIASVNEGRYVHNLTFPAFGVTTPEQAGGTTDVITFTPDRAGTFEYLCGIPGHYDLGMRGTVTVEE